MSPDLIVMAGRPGTGKTTLARALALELGAAYLRVDAAETAIRRAGIQEVGILGYAVVHELAVGTLGVGTGVVVDAVNPVHEARAAWPVLAERCGAILTIFETHLPDQAEHQARVRARTPDIDGHRVPTWPEVLGATYEPWDDRVDGTRHRIDMTDTAAGVRAALTVLGGQSSAADLAG